jgi:hypothetical protein
MEPTQITCTRVEEDDLDARYLAGTLSEEEAEAFEEHYFGCERCWSSVQRGLDVRAANAPVGREAPARAPVLIVEQGAAERPALAPRRRWWPIAIAASLVIVAVGLWSRDDQSLVPTTDVLRGPTDSIRAVASVDGRTLLVTWPPKSGADRYGVRLQRSDATVVIERVIADTSFAISRDSLVRVTDGESVYWEVRALDALRRTIARSRLVPTVVPSRSR